MGTKTLRIKLTPTKDHQDDEVVITFETMDGETETKDGETNENIN